MTKQITPFSWCTVKPLVQLRLPFSYWRRLVFLSVGLLLCGAPASAVESESASKAVTTLSQLLNRPFRKKRNRPTKFSNLEPAVPNSLALATERAGIPLKRLDVALSDLAHFGGPAILRLKNPEQFLVVAAASKKYLTFYQDGVVRVEPQDAYLKRFTKEAYVLAVPAKDSPRVRVDDPIPVVKVVAGNGEVVRTIRLRNTGNRPLAMAVDSTSCGCTEARLSTQTLAPGQVGLLSLKMQVGAWGDKTERITLKTSDPHWPLLVIGFLAQVPTTVVPNPVQLKVDVAKGQEERRNIFVFLPPKASVTKVTTRLPFVKVTLQDVVKVEGGSAQRASVLVTSSSPAGKFADRIAFAIRGAEVPQIEIPIEGAILSDIESESRQIFLGRITPSQIVNKVFIVRSRSGQTFQVKTVTSSDPRVTFKYGAGVESASHAIQVVVAPSSSQGNVIDSEVRVVSSDGQEVSVPLFGMISAHKPGLDAELTSEALNVGDFAPQFSVPDSTGALVDLHAFQGKRNVLLTFFPKCFTGGCTGQMTSIQKYIKDIEASEVEVIAISTDAALDQARFATMVGASFRFVPDTGRKVCRLYQVAQGENDLARRVSFLIDKSSVIRWIDENVNVQSHGQDVLNTIRELSLGPQTPPVPVDMVR